MAGPSRVLGENLLPCLFQPQGSLAFIGWDSFPQLQSQRHHMSLTLRPLSPLPPEPRRTVSPLLRLMGLE